MAQLPGILQGQPLSISYDRFYELASRFLSKGDLEILSTLSLEPPRLCISSGSPLLDSWYNNERALRLALKKARSIKLKRENVHNIEEEDFISKYPSVQQIARNAVSYESPLEAERYLDTYRFSILENLKGSHFFDSDAVFSYGLMVLLHERSDKFSLDAGSASYKHIYNQILENKA